MRVKNLVVLAVACIACALGNELQAQVQESELQSLYGNAGDAPRFATVTKAYHGTSPTRSAFIVKDTKGTALYLTPQGIYRLRDITYVRDLYLNTPFGAQKPGIEYKNEGATPGMPQTFWISNDPINGPYYVIAYSNANGNWFGLTENCVGRPLAP